MPPPPPAPVPALDATRWSNDFSRFVGRPAAVAAELEQLRRELRASLDGRVFERPGARWYRSAYVEAFLFMYDTAFYDRHSGRYRIDELLDDGEREFGGYDVVLLWQSYPRLGIDGRNQIDFYRDMPGGLDGLREVADRAHRRGVRVFVNYNPWDVGTRREPRAAADSQAVADAQALAEVVERIGADGVFLDTMSSDDGGFRGPLERANPDIVFDPEGVPPLSALGSVAGSWLQRRAVAPPELLTIRWVEPRFSFRAVDRTARDHRQLIQRAFFHGCGQVVWENIFGWWNPWPEADRALLRRCVALLRSYAAAFQRRDWAPYIATLAPGVYAHRWGVDPAAAGEPDDALQEVTVYTLINESTVTVHGPVLEAPAAAVDGQELCYYDAWRGQRLPAASTRQGAAGAMVLELELAPGAVGCVVAAPADHDIPLPTLIDADVAASAAPTGPHPGTTVAAEPSVRSTAAAPTPGAPAATISRAPVTVRHLQPLPVVRSAPAAAADRPADMCLVPGGESHFKVRHNSTSFIEGACYGGVDELRYQHHPERLVQLPAFWVDRTEVTNEEYQTFLAATHHQPRDLTNFLRHWQRPPGAAAEPWRWTVVRGKLRHPVVWVDLDDARAFARWAGKRLPLEEEWQRAAGATLWPWGDRFEAGLCNGDSADTTPVDAYPAGASALGCVDLAGNVWEWTESERDDGHTRYAIVRGGSHLVVEGSKWYLASGAQPNDCHEKLLLMYAGLDRCGTVGFRCVKDVATDGGGHAAGGASSAAAAGSARAVGTERAG